MIDYLQNPCLQKIVFQTSRRVADTAINEGRSLTFREVFNTLADDLLEQDLITDGIFFDLAFYLAGHAELMKSVQHYAKGEINEQ